MQARSNVHIEEDVRAGLPREPMANSGLNAECATMDAHFVRNFSIVVPPAHEITTEVAEAFAKADIGLVSAELVCRF